MQIYKENRENILKVLSDVFARYEDDPGVWLEVKDNSVFLAWLAAAAQCGDISDFKDMLLFVLEEEIRRNFVHPALTFSAFIVKLFRIDLTAQFEIIRTNLIKGEMKSEQPQEEEFKFDLSGEMSHLNEESAELWDKINAALLSDGILARFTQVCKELGVIIKSLEDLGLVQNEQRYCFLIQAVGQKRDRKESVKNGFYSRSYSIEESFKFLQLSVKTAINKETMAYRSKLLAELFSSEGNKKSGIFAMTNDLKEAARCLHKTFQGGVTFPLFYKSLFIPGVPHVTEKVKMLTLGHYLGKKIFFDNISGPSQWKPKNSTVYRIWSANKESAPKEMWQQAFPHKFEYFDHLYLRNQGVFVPFSKPRSNVNDPRHWKGKAKI